MVDQKIQLMGLTHPGPQVDEYSVPLKIVVLPIAVRTESIISHLHVPETVAVVQAEVVLEKPERSENTAVSQRRAGLLPGIGAE